MNTKLIKLYDNISKNLEESDELKKIIISNSFPLLLKISQEKHQRNRLFIRIHGWSVWAG